MTNEVTDALCRTTTCLSIKVLDGELTLRLQRQTTACNNANDYHNSVAMKGATKPRGPLVNEVLPVASELISGGQRMMQIDW